MEAFDEGAAMTAAFTEAEKIELALEAFLTAHNYYDLNPGKDSVDREQAFHCFAQVFNADYDIPYGAWMTKTPITFVMPEGYGG